MLRSEEISNCSFCGKAEKADYKCQDNHYVCEECRVSSAEQLIRRTCKSTREKDPAKIADLLMKHPSVPMYGVEHHYLTSCVLLASMKNLGLFNIDSYRMDKAIALARIVPLGSCALWGACGAAIGLGIAFSIAMNVDIMSGEKRSTILNLVSEALQQIAIRGGPRDCKASVRISIDVAKKFIEEKHHAKFD
jgi:hypothetical protein